MWFWLLLSFCLEAARAQDDDPECPDGTKCTPSRFPCCCYYSQARCTQQFTDTFHGTSSCEKTIASNPQAKIFAIIGDYGNFPEGCEAPVRAMVAQWEKQYGPLLHILTTGDNNYWDGFCNTIQQNIGQVYGSYFTAGSCVQPRQGHYYYPNATGTQVAVPPRFWPVPGNHDFDKFNYNNMIPYIQYFPHLAQYAPSLNGRNDYGKGMFYNVVLPNMDGLVSMWGLNSNTGGDPQDPDRMLVINFQKSWLKNTMSASKAAYNLVLFHHAPFTSAQRDVPVLWMRPDPGGFMYKDWGASAVIAGHQHVYERVVGSDGMLYLVNGLGGHERLYGVTQQEGCPAVQGSQLRYNAFHGFQIGVATQDSLQLCMFTMPNGKLQVLDEVTIPSRNAPGGPNNPNGGSDHKGISGGTVICIIFIVSVTLYLGLGMLYRYKRKDARGLDMIPNREFWTSTAPSLIKDGCIFTYRFVKSKTWDRSGYTHV